jgi:hypothetical protein
MCFGASVVREKVFEDLKSPFFKGGQRGIKERKEEE